MIDKLLHRMEMTVIVIGVHCVDIIIRFFHFTCIQFRHKTAPPQLRRCYSPSSRSFRHGLATSHYKKNRALSYDQSRFHNVATIQYSMKYESTVHNSSAKRLFESTTRLMQILRCRKKLVLTVWLIEYVSHKKTICGKYHTEMVSVE